MTAVPTSCSTGCASTAERPHLRSARFGGRGRLLRTELSNAGLTSLRPLLELALVLHHAVRGNHVQVDADLAGIDEISTGGDHAYYADLTRFMAVRPILNSPVPEGN
jgi:hypothetical protein